MIRRARGPGRGQEGYGLVEFALVLPVLVVLLVGTFDLALAAWQSNTLATAVREATRYAIVHGSLSADPVGPGDDAALEAIVRQNAIGIATLTVVSSWPDGDNERGSRVSVVATAPYTPVLSQALLGGGLSVTLRAGSELVIHR